MPANLGDLMDGLSAATKVLLVDDDVVRLTVSGVLEMSGFDVTSAATVLPNRQITIYTATSQPFITALPIAWLRNLRYLASGVPSRISSEATLTTSWPTAIWPRTDTCSPTAGPFRTSTQWA